MLTTVLVFVVTLLVMLYWTSRSKNAPPSPGLSLPVVGHLYLLRGNHVKQFNTWRQRLGDIYTLQMGPYRCVMLSGYKFISEALLKHHDSLLERPRNFSHEELFKYTGIISLGGESWKEQRSFLHSTLRSLGFGRNIMAQRIRIEADCLVDAIKASKAEPIDVSNVLTVCVTNVLCAVIFGKRFGFEDENILKWILVVRRLFEVLGASAPINFFPVLKYVPGDRFHYQELCDLRDELVQMLLKWTDKDNRQIHVSDEDFEDLTQAYLTEIERKKQQGVSTSIDESNFVSSLLSIFNAGTETTANTIGFAIIYLVNFPEIQQRLYEEIKENVGTERAPEMSDKTKLKFLTAFIMETQRYSGVIPLGIDRLATKDIHLGGYTISKGTTVMVNLDSTLTDKESWGDPENFCPERFISEDGSVLYKKELLAFGLGKRNCIGEPLATMELYLFIASLVQRFEFHPENKDQLPTMTPKVGFSKVLQPFKVRAILREP